MRVNYLFLISVMHIFMVCGLFAGADDKGVLSGKIQREIDINFKTIIEKTSLKEELTKKERENWHNTVAEALEYVNNMAHKDKDLTDPAGKIINININLFGYLLTAYADKRNATNIGKLIKPIEKIKDQLSSVLNKLSKAKFYIHKADKTRSSNLLGYLLKKLEDISKKLYEKVGYCAKISQVC